MFFHIVKENETVSDVAAAHRISTAKLIEDNGLVSPYRLLCGDVLMVLSRFKHHTVRGGETLASIAQTYAVKEALLMRLNPMLSANGAVYPGQILTVEAPPLLPVCMMGMVDAQTNIRHIHAVLPYLSYLVIQGGTASQAKRIGHLAKQAGVLPLYQNVRIDPNEEDEEQKTDLQAFFSDELSEEADGYLVEQVPPDADRTKLLLRIPCFYTEDGIKKDGMIPASLMQRLLREGGCIKREADGCSFRLLSRLGGRMATHTYEFTDIKQQKTLLMHTYKQGLRGFWVADIKAWSVKERLLFALLFDPIKVSSECRRNGEHSLR